MQDQRKKVIIAEIENWRKNNLLPEHYCIFLLNLYTAGDRPAEGDGTKPSRGASTNKETAAGKSSNGNMAALGSTFSWKMMFSWFVGACFIALIILLAFHFNDFSTPMQIVIFAGFSLFFYVLAIAFRRSHVPVTHLALALAFLLLLLGGLYFIDKLELTRTVLLLYLALICLLWCINGAMLRFNYLVYCGILGLGILYGVATITRVAYDYDWWRVELYWVPISLLMVGLGFLMQMREHRMAGVFAICGMVLFFGAEIQSLYVPEAKQDVIQLLLFIKVFMSSALFFFTRSFWFTWLRL